MSDDVPTPERPNFGGGKLGEGSMAEPDAAPIETPDISADETTDE